MVAHSNQDDTLNATREKAIRLFTVCPSVQRTARSASPFFAPAPVETTVKDIPTQDSIELLTAVDDLAGEAADPQGRRAIVVSLLPTSPYKGEDSLVALKLGAAINEPKMPGTHGVSRSKVACADVSACVATLKTTTLREVIRLQSVIAGLDRSTI
jgi:hypothetical protein